MSWLLQLPPTELEATIARDGSLIELLQSQFPFIPIGFVRAIVTPDERAALLRMERADFEALLDTILAEVPEVGEILWAHRDWYLREIVALRDAIVGAHA